MTTVKDKQVLELTDRRRTIGSVRELLLTMQDNGSISDFYSNTYTCGVYSFIRVLVWSKDKARCAISTLRITRNARDNKSFYESYLSILADKIIISLGEM